MQNRAGLHLVFVVAGIVLGICAFSFSAESQKGFNPEDFGLGLDTQSRTARDGAQVFSIAGSAREMRELLPEWRITKMYALEGLSKRVLWLGASQLHAINKRRPEDRLAVEYANALVGKWAGRTVYFQLSSPNASLNDILSLYLIGRWESPPDWVVIALVYDDLREHPRQKMLLEFVPEVSAADTSAGGEPLAALDTERALLGKETEEKHVIERNAVLGTPQERLEHYLIDLMAKILPGYQYRDTLNAKVTALISNVLTRVAVEISLVRFGAKVAGAQRYADIPPHLVEWNFAALRSLILLARHDGAKVLIYRQPIRPPDGTFYHNRADYDAFFARVRRELSYDNVHFLDLENIVPQNLWGTTNLGFPDVFHFTAEGHKLLAAAIDKFMQENP